MHCPGCGAQTSIEQKFCRVCGMNLEALSIALATQSVLPDSNDSHATAISHTSRRIMPWMRWGFIIMFVGAFLGVIGKKFIHDDIMSGVGALIAIAGIFLICFGSLPTLAPRSGKSRQSKPVKAPAQAKPTMPIPLELLPESVSSVTENTTELLEVEKIKVSARPRD
jgi:hypothetical protein